MRAQRQQEMDQLKEQSKESAALAERNMNFMMEKMMEQ